MYELPIWNLILLMLIAPASTPNRFTDYRYPLTRACVLTYTKVAPGVVLIAADVVL